MRILFVEDDESARRALTMLSKKMPEHQIDFADTSAKAEQLLTEHEYDLVFSDYDLGQGSKTGYDILLQLPKGTDKYLMTGSISTRQLSGVDVLEKPFRFHTLRALIEKTKHRRNEVCRTKH